MSSKSKTQLSLQDKKNIIDIIVGGKPNFTQIARDFNLTHTEQQLEI